MLKIKKYLMIASFAGFPFASQVASGNDLSHIDAGVLLQILVEKGILTDAEVNRAIERSRDAGSAPARSAAIHDHPPVPYEPTEPLGDSVVNTRVKRFGVEEADGSNRFRIRGRLMADFAYVDWDDAQRTIDGDLGSYGSIIRRARLGVLGVWNYDWEWQMEVDFRDAEIRFANAYIAYLGFDQARIAIGHFKEPFSMESSTSSRRLTFLERATPVDAYRPSREMGILYETLRKNFYAGLGLYGGQSVASERRISEGYSIAGRASYALINENDRFLHVGGSLNYRDNAYRSRPGRDKEYVDVRLRSREGARAVDGRLVGLNDIANVTNFNRMALEFAKGYGPLAVQAEYVKVQVNRALDRESLDLGGYYVQASYNLTGESHNYRATSGDFGLPRVNNPLGNGGAGAWQIAARFAKANSISKDYNGHKMEHYTLGLNWYPIPEIIFKFNYIYLDAENAAGARTLANVYAFRAQLEF